MGRFYRTDKPTFVNDNMLQLPFQEMASTLQKVEGDIAGGEALAESYITKMLEAKALQPEQEKLNTILTGYEDRIEELTSLVQKNPLEFRKSLGDIRRVGRELNEDFTRGDVARIQGNYASYQKFQEENKKRIGAKENSLIAPDLNEATNYLYNQFVEQADRFYNLEEGEAPVFQAPELSAFQDVTEISEKLGEDYISDATSNLGYRFNGQYLVNSKNEFVSKEEIKQGVLQGLMDNAQLKAYYQDRIKFSGDPQATIGSVQKQIERQADRVADKYSFNKQTLSSLQESVASKEARARRTAKYKKELDNPEVKFNFTSGTTKQIHSKDTFNPQGIKDKIPILEQQLEQFKNTRTSNQIDENKRLRSIAEVEAKLFNTKKFNEESENYVIDNSVNKGNISGEESKFIKSYLLKDKGNIERIVKEGIEKYNLDNKYFNAYLIPLSRSGSKGITEFTKELNETISNADPEFIQAFDEYRKAKDVIARVNGEDINPTRNPYEFQETFVDEKAQKEWYDKNAEANTLYEKGISISENDKEMMSLVDAYVGANSGDFKTYDTNELATNPATGKPTEREDITVNGNILTPKNLGGKKMSDVFTLVNVVPGVNNTKMIYKYDEVKIEALEEEGIELDIDGLENGELFTFESNNSQLNTYLSDRYQQDQNPEVVLTSRLFTPEGSKAVNVFNYIDNVLTDVTNQTYEQGPGKYFTVEGTQFRVSKNPNNTYVLQLEDDKKYIFNSSYDVKLGILEYLGIGVNPIK